MTKDEMIQTVLLNPAVQTNPVQVTFYSQPTKAGFFLKREHELNEQNKWRFVPNISALKFQQTNSNDDTIVLDGFDIESIRFL